MLFSEIYGSYFNVVAAVLSEASAGCLTDKRMTELIQDKAFAESTLSIPAAIKKETWPLLAKDLNTVIQHSPTMPLTELQKRWLKALLQDPRIALFNPDTTGLDDVEPLYKPGTFVLFDQYNDGDPYEDENYIACFRTVLQSIREKRMLRIRFRGHTGIRHSLVCMPYRLEYSAKDDFPAGQFITEKSNAAMSLMKIIRQAFEGDFAKYLEDGKEVKIIITGSADASRILNTKPYDERYGKYVDEPYYKDGNLNNITVTKESGIAAANFELKFKQIDA